MMTQTPFLAVSDAVVHIFFFIFGFFLVEARFFSFARMTLHAWTAEKK